MKYSLRSLMVVVALLPPILALGWLGWKSISWEEPPRIPLGGPPGIRGPHFVTPSYNNREVNEFMLKEERKGRTWKAIDN